MRNILFICAALYACHSEEAQYPDSEETQSESDYQSAEPQEETSTEETSTEESAEEPVCDDPCMGCEWFPSDSALGCDGCKSQKPHCE